MQYHTNDVGGFVHENENNIAPLVSSVQLDCSGCHVLREIFHTNGEKSMKLVIHGGIGVFFHAVLDVFFNTDGLPPVMEKSFFDFSTETFDGVKRFLVDYGQLKVLDRYIIIHDSISSFYDVLCTKMSHNDVGSTQGVELQMPQPEEMHVSWNPIRNPKTRIATQVAFDYLTGNNSLKRERTGKLQLSDLAQYFHLPMTEASKQLKLCSTAIKKICRKYGIIRWPYRKIKSIDKMISNLLNKTRPGDAQNLDEIEKLRERRAQICAGSV
ncbi:RWP-RK domain-containing protein [Dioscorea alata]|uniref:RWP-RK domain-containing protein n=1 Tax=Dioscorea alata TaxID=55571 RepID=A0ACB7W8G4_DIOAL|nr:RWP-RK domain-containing protein [Dioscorea alata]